MAELERSEEKEAVNTDETVRRAFDRGHRDERNGGMLYPLLLVAAIAIIVFSIIGIATMTGVMPNAVERDGAVRQSGGEAHKGKPQRIETPRQEPVPRPGNPRSAMMAPAHSVA